MTTTLNKNKYQDTIFYLCQKLNGEIRGKKKLAKLLYFADFDFYEKNEKSITGDIYKKLPMGPFPTALDDITASMAEKNFIVIERVEELVGYNPTEVYRCISDHEASKLNSEEKKMLDRIAIKYGHLNGKQLEDLSHAEAPYVASEFKQEIPYEFAFYRGTDFNDL